MKWGSERAVLPAALCPAGSPRGLYCEPPPPRASSHTSLCPSGPPPCAIRALLLPDTPRRQAQPSPHLGTSCGKSISPPPAGLAAVPWAVPGPPHTRLLAPLGMHPGDAVLLSLTSRTVSVTSSCPRSPGPAQNQGAEETVSGVHVNERVRGSLGHGGGPSIT